jgi:hypothetical protein
MGGHLAATPAVMWFRPSGTALRSHHVPGPARSGARASAPRPMSCGSSQAEPPSGRMTCRPSSVRGVGIGSTADVMWFQRSGTALRSHDVPGPAPSGARASAPRPMSCGSSQAEPPCGRMTCRPAWSGRGHRLHGRCHVVPAKRHDSSVAGLGPWTGRAIVRLRWNDVEPPLGGRGFPLRRTVARIPTGRYGVRGRNHERSEAGTGTVPPGRAQPGRSVHRRSGPSTDRAPHSSCAAAGHLPGPTAALSHVWRGHRPGTRSRACVRGAEVRPGAARTARGWRRCRRRPGSRRRSRRRRVWSASGCEWRVPWDEASWRDL